MIFRVEKIRRSSHNKRTNLRRDCVAFIVVLLLKKGPSLPTRVFFVFFQLLQSDSTAIHYSSH
ncbi:TPA: hypothetical protein MIR31_15020 [Klebsiella pneumoniae]|nr:hypothetical protein [Klebsiella pneumoniae]HBY1881448.1 hypothetical protein [Klebsiella pneumoniae]HBY1937754.1 hypothetical protein [Klebsiella pneumoniae]HBY1942456.1 hypothetical protein [Klebsiella pneumoniae]HBY1948022.1 hypothetical protein [Klebsiella pneumoniae]